MSELRLGKMTTRELAAWMGISYNTFKKDSEKRYEELEPYAKFKKIYGGVIIEEVYVKEYDKKGFSETHFNYINCLDQTKDGLMTVSALATLLAKKNLLPRDIREEAARKRLTQSRNYLYGKPEREKDGVGLIGTDRYVWAVKLSGYNNYRQMTEQERQIFSDAIDIVMTSKNEKEKLMSYGLYLMDREEDEEVKEIPNSNDFLKASFKKVLDLFYDKTGFRLVRATEHTSNEKAKKLFLERYVESQRI